REIGLFPVELAISIKDRSQQIQIRDCSLTYRNVLFCIHKLRTFLAADCADQILLASMPPPYTAVSRITCKILLTSCSCERGFTTQARNQNLLFSTVLD